MEFKEGETMPMHEFLSRYQAKICGGVIPQFYACMVTVIDEGAGGMVVDIEYPSSPSTGEERGEGEDL